MIELVYFIVEMALMIASLGLIVAAFFMEERRARLQLWAAISGISGALISLVQGVWLAIHNSGALEIPVGLLIVSGAFMPVIIIVGGMLTLYRRESGPIVLLIGTVLSLVNIGIGYIAAFSGFFG